MAGRCLSFELDQFNCRSKFSGQDRHGQQTFSTGKYENSSVLRTSQQSLANLHVFFATRGYTCCFSFWSLRSSFTTWKVRIQTAVRQLSSLGIEEPAERVSIPEKASSA